MKRHPDDRKATRRVEAGQLANLAARASKPVLLMCGTPLANGTPVNGVSAVAGDDGEHDTAVMPPLVRSAPPLPPPRPPRDTLVDSIPYGSQSSPRPTVMFDPRSLEIERSVIETLRKK